MLRSPQAFERVFRAGRFTVKDHLVMHFAPNETELTRFGLVLAGKVAVAARRNLLRRRMREILRSLLPRIQPGYDVVFVLRQDTGESFAALKAKLMYLLAVRGLLQEAEGR